MSGPKDFVIIFAAARMAQVAARRLAEQQARQARARARQEEQRRRAEQRAAELAARRVEQEVAANRQAAAVKDRLSQHRERIARQSQRAETQSPGLEQADSGNDVPDNRQSPKSNHPHIQSADPSFESTRSCEGERETAIAALQTQLDDLEKLNDVQAGTAAARLSQQLSELGSGMENASTASAGLQRIENEARIEVESAAERARLLKDRIDELLRLEAELRADESVLQFCGGVASDVMGQMQSLFGDYESGHAVDIALEQSELLIRRARETLASAEGLQAAFATRNELIADVVSSLQEIGFFVDDPQFENPSDPAGPVSVIASRGAETISAQVDLKDSVRTVWNGISDEHCKDSFFRYVDRMNAKGVYPSQEPHPTSRFKKPWLVDQCHALMSL